MFNYRDMNVNYITEGTGEDVIILHGWGASIGAVMPIVRLLSPHFRVTAIDLPGCGKTSDPTLPFYVKDYADLVLEICKRENITECVIIAHSNGGRIAVELNTASPLKVIKNIFIDTAGVPAKKSFKVKFKTKVFKLGKKILSAVGAKKALYRLSNKMGSEDYRNASPVMKKTMVNMLSLDMREQMKDITAPTLLIWGENDTATPLYTAREMEKIISDCGLVVLSGAGHFSYLDCPSVFNAAVKSFLQIRNCDENLRFHQ